MKLTKPENESYAATVVTIKEVHPFPGSDNIVGTNLFGFQAIVGVATQSGERGIVFPPETQLSEEYAKENNLHQHGDLNKDQGAKGYLGDNRRIRAIRLRGNRSDCLFMPLSSLSYIKGLDTSKLADGDTFDTIGDNAICNKYVIKRSIREQRLDKNKDKFIRVDKKFLPEHYDSDQWYKHSESVPGETTVIVTQKLHGTSIRVGHTIVTRKLTIRDRFAKVIGARIQENEMDYVFGSRKVIKDINNPNQNHFYSTDIWTDEGRKLEGIIPENFLVYGELLGWTPNGAAIQKNYTYQIPHATCDLYVYRVAFVNGQGKVVDLSWDQVKEFCKDTGLRHVPELWRGKKSELQLDADGQPFQFIDQRFHESGYVQAVPLDKESPVDEGVCIRVDGLAPYILKAKGPQFYEHETKMLDEEAEDLEAEGSEA